MGNKVGPKGQVMIERETRDKLNVTRGSVAVQKLVGNHVEIRFVTPPQPVQLHNRSLRGILKPPPGVTLPQEDWHAIREKAWHDAIMEDEEWWRTGQRSETTTERT